MKLLPVSVADDEELPKPGPTEVTSSRLGAIHIQLPGEVRMSLEGSVVHGGLVRTVLKQSLSVISLPAGTRIWIAAGVTDLWCGFAPGLSAQGADGAFEQQPLFGPMCLSFVDVAATSSRRSGSMETDYVCWPRGLNEDASCGRRRPVAPCR